MIDNFRKILVDDLKESVGGYFYKRQSHYFDKKDKVRSNFFTGILQKVRTKYDKRYFKIDLNESSFTYAKDQESINNPAFKVMLRDVISVTRNTVSMPIEAANGQITF